MTTSREQRRLISKVNTTPTGLQNLLGNVNQGINPSELNPQIASIVDLFPHWAANKLIKESAQASIALVHGQGINITVPSGQLWVPIAASFESPSAGTNDDRGHSVGIVDPANTGMVALASLTYTNIPGGTGTTLRTPLAFPQRILLTGGWGIRGEIDGSTQTGAQLCTLEVLYYKLTD